MIHRIITVLISSRTVCAALSLTVARANALGVREWTLKDNATDIYHGEKANICEAIFVSSPSSEASKSSQVNPT